MIIEGKDLDSAVREDVDVCIIGSGAGGATVARELAGKGLSVVVLEEGGAYFTEDFTGKVKDGFFKMTRNMGLDATTGIPSIIVPTGRCLGGTTTVNMGTCFRAPDSVLNEWVKMGLEGFGPADMAPYYDKVEKDMSVQEVRPEVMGRGGEIISEGARKLGLHPRPLKRNVNDKCRGCGNCAYGCTEGAKESMVVKIIPDADKLGAKFYCDVKAQILTGEKDGVTGVHGMVIDRRSGKYRFNVDVSAKVVVLSMGSLCTPAFLLKNKIGNKSGKVGKGLKLHLCARTIGIFEEEINSHLGVCQNMYIDDYVEQGIMMEATFTGPASQLPGLAGIGPDLWDVCKQYRHMASLGIMISEKGQGRVRADGDGEPAMSFHLRDEDAETLYKAMIICDRVLFSAGARKVINGNFAVPEVLSMSDLDRISREKTKPSDWILMAFHPQGTCRMGVNPKKSVVGPTGEFHDVQNLYIADGSVFPTSLGVNPQETIWAISVRVAEAIAQKLGSAGA